MHFSHICTSALLLATGVFANSHSAADIFKRAEQKQEEALERRAEHDKPALPRVESRQTKYGGGSRFLNSNTQRTSN